MSLSSILVPQESTSLLFPTLALILTLIFLLTKHLSSKYSPPLPPGPFPWPILGNIPQLVMAIWRREPMQETSSRLSKSYGSDLVSLKLGSQLVVVGTTRVAAAEILKAHDRNLSARYVPDALPAARPQLNNCSVGWTLECNDSWKSLRTTCRSELFSSKALQSQEWIREKRVAEMLGIVGEMQGREVSVRNVAFATMYNMMSNILVSRDLLNMEDEISRGEIGGLIRSAMELQSLPNISDLYPILRFLDVQKLRKRSMDMYHMVSKRWEAMVKERKLARKTGDSSIQQDFLDVLIKDGSSADQINLLIPELLVAGTDSSVVTIEWSMAELVKNPKCMKMVQEELKREIHSQGLKVTESILPKLKYLEACIKEALRLHPPGPLLIPRRAAEACTVMNYNIPKNTQVLINVWAIGRDPRNWEDPLVFKPERFLDSSTVDFKGNDFEYLPFGGGRRICPGLPMASKHVPLIVASLINSFDWSLPGEKGPKDLDMSEANDLLLRKKEPLVLVPRAKIID